jgi:hypothetical protein
MTIPRPITTIVVGLAFTSAIAVPNSTPSERASGEAKLLEANQSSVQVMAWGTRRSGSSGTRW